MTTSSTTTIAQPAPRPLSAARKEKLRKYWSTLDKGAGGCRLGRRHWVLGIEEFDGDDPRFTIEPVSGVQGMWQIVTYCTRCGMPYVYTADRRTGHIEMKGRADYSKMPHYLFTEENGGDGTPMTSQDLDYLRKLTLDAALEARETRAASNAPAFRSPRKPRKDKALVMDKRPVADVQFSSTG
jgi:hypothetical protein